MQWTRIARPPRGATASFALMLSISTCPAWAEPDARTPAPDFVLPTANGSVSLSQLKGKVVYVDFWASWCEPCRRSFPWMNALAMKHKDGPFVLVAINLDKKRELADAFVAKNEPIFTVVFDPEGKTAAAYKVKAMPSSFVIGADGQIAYSHFGFDAKDTAGVEAAIARELALAAPKEGSK
ncbi:MAG: TlpA family protein disulfide reductase [Candidatus Eisenbacteria bacterium]|nr:TlpA family protein disulfide reductase [Candidatus Eisenbacteria bacterium]